MQYEARHSADRGWYVVSDEGHLAHVPDPDTRELRAAIFEREADAQRCAEELSRLGTLS
ncbi:hypothetical protein [Streptomyces sp. RFCAC02]|uniref:hypothetical protein n=1 Tax=Streptomyces sp. RFCAC02 TaxID=2499143 RepID=UPI00143D4F97|nr:hypothetical protein [Streptomyces sp. RFCAC02]